MALKLKTAPTKAILTVQEVSDQSRVDFNDDDALLDRYIDAITSYFDGPSGILGRLLTPQSWEYYRTTFPCGNLRLPIGPVTSIDRIDYIDSSGVLTLWDSTNYVTDLVSDPPWISPVNMWPTTKDTLNAVKITFTGGYSTVPDAIKQAALLIIAQWYENRENVITDTRATVQVLPFHAESLIAPFRRIGF